MKTCTDCVHHYFPELNLNNIECDESLDIYWGEKYLCDCSKCPKFKQLEEYDEEEYYEEEPYDNGDYYYDSMKDDEMYWSAGYWTYE